MRRSSGEPSAARPLQKPSEAPSVVKLTSVTFSSRASRTCTRKMAGCSGLTRLLKSRIPKLVPFVPHARSRPSSVQPGLEIGTPPRGRLRGALRASAIDCPHRCRRRQSFKSPFLQSSGSSHVARRTRFTNENSLPQMDCEIESCGGPACAGCQYKIPLARFAAAGESPPCLDWHMEQWNRNRQMVRTTYGSLIQACPSTYLKLESSRVQVLGAAVVDQKIEKTDQIPQ